MKTRKIGDLEHSYSMIEITHESGRIEYAIVCNYHPEAEPGSQWDWGHYYDDFAGACRGYASLMKKYFDED